MILEHLKTVPDESVFNPTDVRGRGRPSGSTQRNLSNFEQKDDAEAGIDGTKQKTVQ